MIVAATEQNIAWLVDKLYVIKRYVQLDRREHLVFVLLTKGKDDRMRVESIFLNHFAKIYCIDKIELCSTSDWNSRFEFPELGCSVVLMDV